MRPQCNPLSFNLQPSEGLGPNFENYLIEFWGKKMSDPAILMTQVLLEGKTLSASILQKTSDTVPDKDLVQGSYSAGVCQR